MIYQIYTNNPLVDEHIKKQSSTDKYEIKWMTAPANDVLVCVRTAIRNGAILVSNPMSGVRTVPNYQPKRSIQTMKKNNIELPKKDAKRPNQESSDLSSTLIAHNPYMSVLVSSPKDAMDFKSIKQIEEALVVYRKNASLRFMAHRDESVIQFQKQDLDCLLEALVGLDNTDI